VVKDQKKKRDGTLKSPECRTVEKKVKKILQMGFAGASTRILLLVYPA